MQIEIDVLPLRAFGLERLDEDKAIVAFAARNEARILRWLDFARGALLFLAVPGDPESGWFYIFDRRRAAIYSLSLPVEGHFGGFHENEFEPMTRAFDLVRLAQSPALLRAA